jgi:hypothetical protein
VATDGSDALRGYAKSDDLGAPPEGWSYESAAQRGGYHVLYADLDSLTTENLRMNAVPWRLLAQCHLRRLRPD